MRFKSIFALSLMAACSIYAQQQIPMVVDTYTDGGSKGIYTYRFNQDTGKVVLLDSLAIKNPSYLTVSDDKRYIYAVSETDVSQASLSGHSSQQASLRTVLLKYQRK